MKVVYEDNHLIIVFKEVGEIVQGDKTGDEPLAETVKQYIKEKYQKPGNVFLGVVHRLDRPVAGLVIFGRTSKAVARLDRMFHDSDVHKTYWALVPRQKNQRTSRGIIRQPLDDGWTQVTSWILRNEKQNKSYSYDHEVPESKKAVLKCRIIGTTDNYQLVEVNLMTGRHHQIRCQLSALGYPIKGDLKYGAPRSNPDGGISLLAHRITFVHPVSKTPIDVTSPLPDEPLWQALEASVDKEDKP